MAKFPIGTVVTLAAVGVGGYLIYKYLLSDTSTGTGSNNASIDQAAAQSAANDLAASKAAGSKQTLPDTTLTGYATSIFQIIGNAGGDPVIDSGSAAQVDQIITQVNTDTDWYRLVQLFGTKKFNSGGAFSTCALVNLGCDSYDLPGLLRLTMPAANLASINSYFSEQGMNAYV